MKAKLPIATTLHVGTTTNGSVRGGALVSSYVWTRPGLLFFQSTGADLELFWGFVLLSTEAFLRKAPSTTFGADLARNVGVERVCANPTRPVV